MSQQGQNEINDNTGLLWNGFDYEHQAWVLDGIYQDCGHPASLRQGGKDCCQAHNVAGLKVIDVANLFPQANV